MHTARRCLALGSLVAMVAACGVGDPAGPPPESDERNDVLGILCNAEYDVAGTFTPGTPTRPAEIPTGCWPVGTWTFTATMRSNECAAPPSQLATQYAFRVDRTPDATNGGWEETYTYLGTGMAHRLKVSEGGGGECEGGLELYSTDGTEWWNLKPALTGTTIDGFAEYSKYAEDQRNPNPGEL